MMMTIIFPKDTGLQLRNRGRRGIVEKEKESRVLVQDVGGSVVVDGRHVVEGKLEL